MVTLILRKLILGVTMKFIKKAIILICLIILYVYVCNITFFPNKIIIMQGEELNYKTALGLILCDDSSMQTSSNINKKKISDSGTIDVSLNLFGKIPLKETKVNVVERTAVIPIGKAIGMKLYTDGVLVVGMSEINGKKPYENSGIQEGDRIIKIDNKQISSSDELIKTVNKSNGNDINITYKRNDETMTASIKPVMTKEKEYKRNLRIGRVYQNPAMGTCPSMTILENLSIADNKGKTYGLGRGTNHSRIEHYKEMLAELNLGLEDKLHTKVGALSGGQRQTLALLMATMNPIEFLILDEHTAALDPKTAEIVMQLTGKIVAEKKVTTIMVTHNLRYAVEYGDRLIMMHQGKAIIDKAGADKKAMQVDDILGTFNEISIECGN